MIRLTRLNSHALTINSDLIKFIENAPDTVITLTTGEKIVVLEGTDDVLRRIIAFRRAVLAGLLPIGTDPNSALALTQTNAANPRDPEAGGRSRG
ncbi:MAG TPA: flagellar FlbD family protein [Terriglobales bacterium]|jgi:flagellar protein FlbD|nr:flagellar FlbD family protein [Terriglobales bacterium]